jgi:hypothetical protein
MSAQKQCPKCGEKNPAEAVMCWACYTSLSGGAMAAPAGAGPVGGAIAAGTMDDAGDKKKIEPKQLAIIGVGLVVALGFAAKTMMGSGAAPEDVMPDISATGSSGGSSTTTTSTSSSSSSSTSTTPAATGPNPGGPAAAAADAPPFPYRLAVGPNPGSKWATMAIVPNKGAMKESEAKALAEFAYRYQQKSRKFPVVEIFVINSSQDADTFAEYQNKRRGDQMGAGDYQALRQVWGNTPVRYLNVNGRATVSSPQRNPDAFWQTNR